MTEELQEKIKDQMELARLGMFLMVCLAFVLIFSITGNFIKGIKFGNSNAETRLWGESILAIMMFVGGAIYFLGKPNPKN